MTRRPAGHPFTFVSVSERRRVKVCGITEPDAARAAAGADWLGLVLAPSPRRVDEATAAGLTAGIDAAWVGVFVDADPDEVAGVADRLGLAAVQLHGAETPDTCRRVREATGRPVWKAVRWDADPARLDAWAAEVDALLVDAAIGDRLGGTGRALPWEALAERWARDRRPAPTILAGGLGPDNVARAIEVVDPDGVDASSRLERAPGRKDPRLVRAYVEAARATRPTTENAR